MSVIMLPSSNGPLDLQDVVQQFVGSDAEGKDVFANFGRQYDTGHVRLRRFAAIPSASKPRWLISLENSSCARESWRIYTPFTFRAQLLKKIFVQLANTGWTGWARHPLSIASTSVLPIERLVRNLTGETNPVFAISLGTPGEFRKLTIQAMRRDGTVLGYLKLPLTEKATQRVQHEAAALKHLGSFQQLREHVPRIQHAGDWGPNYILFQSPGPYQSGPVDFGAVHEKFLHKLRTINDHDRAGSALVEEVRTKWERALPKVTSELAHVGTRALYRAAQDLQKTKIRCGISHGDFTPWNIRTNARGELFVLDWECMDMSLPICWDRFHFRMQVAGLLNRRAALRALETENQPGDRACLWLYLLHSICRCLEESGGRGAEIDIRFQFLASELR